MSSFTGCEASLFPKWASEVRANLSGTEEPSRSTSAMQRPRWRPGNPTALHQRASAGRSGWRRVGEPSAAACTAQKLLCGRAAGGTGAASSDRRHPGQCSRRISQEGRWDLEVQLHVATTAVPRATVTAAAAAQDHRDALGKAEHVEREQNAHL